MIVVIVCYYTPNLSTSLIHTGYSQCLPGSSNPDPPAATTVVKPPATTNPPSSGSTSIDVKIKARGKQYFGAATDQNRLTDGSSASIIQGRFGCVTPENSMKWDAIERQSNILCSHV